MRLHPTRAMPTGLRCEVCRNVTQSDDHTSTHGCIADDTGAAHVVGGVLIAAPRPPAKCVSCNADALPFEDWCQTHLDEIKADMDKQALPAEEDTDTADDSGSDDDGSQVQPVRGLEGGGEAVRDVPPDAGGDGP